MTDEDYIETLKDELARIGGLYEQARRDVEILRVRNQALQNSVKELLSK